WAMASEPVLCFDGDGAGRRAAFRAIETALPLIGPGKTLRFALLPEGQGLDTPESRAALERRLGEQVRKIADETLRRHYAADMRRRLSAFLGDGREGPASGEAGGRRGYGARQGGRFAPLRPRTGVAQAPLAPQMKLARKARSPAREIMILAIALSHPELIESRCEDLAAAEFVGAGFAPLRDALIGAPAEALGSAPALAEWLNGAGRGEERERI